jgi:hypothetical protein
MAYNPLPDTINDTINKYQPLSEDIINSEQYEEYINCNDLFKLINLYFLNALLNDLSVIRNQRHVDRIKRNDLGIEIYSSQIGKDPKKTILSSKSIFYNGMGLQKNTDIRNKITILFKKTLRYIDNILYDLEHIEISNNAAILTYKSKESKIKITLNENKTITMQKEGRCFLSW